MAITDEITISLQEYKSLITKQNKYEQLKKFLMLENTNQKITNVLCAIEGKNAFDLWEELKEKKY